MKLPTYLRSNAVALWRQLRGLPHPLAALPVPKGGRGAGAGPWLPDRLDAVVAALVALALWAAVVHVIAWLP